MTERKHRPYKGKGVYDLKKKNRKRDRNKVGSSFAASTCISFCIRQCRLIQVVVRLLVSRPAILLRTLLSTKINWIHVTAWFGIF